MPSAGILRKAFVSGLAAAGTIATLGGAPADRVAVVVHADRPVGPMKPIWAFFGYDEPNYTYMKDGEKLLSRAGGAEPGAGLRPRAQPADDRRRHAGVEVGLHQRLHRRRDGKPHYDWTIVDRILDTYVEREDEAAGRDRLHAARRSRRSRSRTATTGSRARPTTTSIRAGPIRRRTTPSGAS